MTRNNERGYIAIFMCLILAVLVIFAGFSVDVGGFYARASKLQRAADAAALAGVVYMPTLGPGPGSADAAARATATENGFTSGVDNITVTVAGVLGNSHQLRVTITDAAVDQFFSKSVLSNETISRSATAEYVLPVPLGSPDNKLGNQTNLDTQNLWASISGPGTDKVNGDPYSTKCSVGQSSSAAPPTCSGNTGSGGEYRTSGYLYSIDVPAADVGKKLTVAVWDAGNYARASYASVDDADNGTVNTMFELFAPSLTPLDSTTYTASGYSLNGKCDVGTAGRWIILNGASAATYENKFVNLCTITAPAAGTYHLQVKSSAIPGVTDSGNGWNQFSLKATFPTAPQPALFGYGDLSLFNNLQLQVGNLTATFYLAQVGAQYAGKQLTVSLFDPGDGASGTYYVNILKPGSNTVACSYGLSGATPTAANPCRIQTRTSTGTNTYNGKWLDITIAIPTTYTCTPDCWWRVKYEFNGVTAGNSPNDRTVWTADITGDPVHLVNAS